MSKPDAVGIKIVLTGLDGSLLDPQTNRFGAARQALSALERRSIPVVLITHKTRAQVEFIQHQIPLEHPFIAESGLALYVPEHYFPESILDSSWSYVSPYYIQSLGLSYPELRQVLQSIRPQLETNLVGYGDWTPSELASMLGLPIDEVERLQQRSYSEVFTYSGSPQQLAEVLKANQVNWPNHQFHLRPLSPSDQLDQWVLTAPGLLLDTSVQPLSQATRLLLQCYQNHLGILTSLGIGSSLWDYDFLQLAHERIVLPGPYHEPLWAQRYSFQPSSHRDPSQVTAPEPDEPSNTQIAISEEEGHWRLAELPGPEGWNEAVLMWLEDTDHGDD